MHEAVHVSDNPFFLSRYPHTDGRVHLLRQTQIPRPRPPKIRNLLNRVRPASVLGHYEKFPCINDEKRVSRRFRSSGKEKV